jgi:hypothetical protein
MYTYIKSYISPSKEGANKDGTEDDGPKVDKVHESNGHYDDDDNNNNGHTKEKGSTSETPTEKTSLLGHPDDPSDEGNINRRHLFQNNQSEPPPPPPPKTALDAPDHFGDGDDDPVHPLPKHSPSVYDFYFNETTNPTVQRYYRFSATPITPIVALHKKPGAGNNSTSNVSGGVTGLLRRSAVVPSHGTDSSGDWILVSVGGRSGWARKKQPTQHFSGFTLAGTFTATEAWMGNHVFWCGGKCMLGSDAPSLVFTNVLILVGYVWHFVIVLPKLRHMEELGHLNLGFWRSSTTTATTTTDVGGETPVTTTIFWWSVVLGTLVVVTLWISALMDPGIIPPVSSPIKAPLPENVPLGGPLGYRYCSTCNIFRPPRSKHCNSCNVCVSKFDQYVQPCVGDDSVTYAQINACYFLRLRELTLSLSLSLSYTCTHTLSLSWFARAVTVHGLEIALENEITDFSSFFWLVFLH